MKISNFKLDNNLPSTIGVYIFRDVGGMPLYVGKSVNIKARIKSHLENAKIDEKERAIIENASEIETVSTSSEFEALFLESQLIQKLHPRYNQVWKDDKSYLYLRVSFHDLFPKPLLVRKTEIKPDGAEYFGPFHSKLILEKILRQIRKIIPFCTAKRITSSPCFHSKIGLCRPCPNQIGKDLKQRRKYRKNLRNLVKIFRGQSEFVLKEWRKDLKNLIREERYENALVVRDQIRKLENLLTNQIFDELAIEEGKRNVDLLKSLRELLRPFFPQLSSLFRIECFDVSNFSFRQNCAAMTVAISGQIDKSQYRKFKIDEQKFFTGKLVDWELMKSVLARRFKHKEWSFPNLLVLDGGKPQVEAVKKLLNELNVDLPVLGLAKNPDRLVIGIAGLPTVKPSFSHPGFNLLRLLRDEAHRFGRKYHLALRDKKFLKGKEYVF